MSDDLDDYAPAIEPTSNNAEASVESLPSGKAAAAEVAGDAPVEKIGSPPGEDDPAAGPEPGPKAQRVWTGKSRALFRQLAAKGGVGADMADDLQPMEHTPPAAAAPTKPAPPAAPAPTTEPSKQPAAAAPLPGAAVTPPPGLPDLPDLPLPPDPGAATPAAPDPKLAEREQALTAREAALAEREKLLPDRRALIEDPGAATIAWLKDTYGITDDGDLKTAVADLITDLSVKGLKIGVPDEHINGMNSRKATRVVKTYTADVDRRDRALKEREAQQAAASAAERDKQTVAQQEAAYVAHLGELIAPAAAQHRFLHDPEVTGGLVPAAIVYEVLKEQKRLGQKPDLASATKYADDYYRVQAEQYAKRAARFQSLLAPATPAAAQPAAKPAAPAPAAVASPGGAPGPAPTPAAKPEPQRDPSDLPDRRSARAATFAKLRARAEQPNT
ncbi:MAG: hypothetical protein V4515_15150 [Chloroflexota bacterium]